MRTRLNTYKTCTSTFVNNDSLLLKNCKNINKKNLILGYIFFFIHPYLNSSISIKMCRRVRLEQDKKYLRTE